MWHNTPNLLGTTSGDLPAALLQRVGGLFKVFLLGYLCKMTEEMVFSENWPCHLNKRYINSFQLFPSSSNLPSFPTQSYLEVLTQHASANPLGASLTLLRDHHLALSNQQVRYFYFCNRFSYNKTSRRAYRQRRR